MAPTTPALRLVGLVDRESVTLGHRCNDEQFGEIGIDGALLADSGAVLKEIPGGCMCCVNGLPMQVGLNMLLQQAKPDRLLIEPTGLGHPKQILSLLTQESYAGWIDLQATLCLLDARQLSQPRYRDNENFRDQLAAADVAEQLTKIRAGHHPPAVAVLAQMDMSSNATAR